MSASIQVASEQILSSHGNETSKDAYTPAEVRHTPGEAILKPAYPAPCSGVTHTPVHNPINTIGPEWLLNRIEVHYDAVDGASVETVTLYYDNMIVLKSKVDSAGIATVSGITPYKVDTGICVTLASNFPTEGSYVKLRSVNLLYRSGLGDGR